MMESYFSKAAMSHHDITIISSLALPFFRDVVLHSDGSVYQSVSMIELQMFSKSARVHSQTDGEF